LLFANVCVGHHVCTEDRRAHNSSSLHCFADQGHPAVHGRNARVHAVRLLCTTAAHAHRHVDFRWFSRGCSHTGLRSTCVRRSWRRAAGAADEYLSGASGGDWRCHNVPLESCARSAQSGWAAVPTNIAAHFVAAAGAGLGSPLSLRAAE
jgi:hypothetical protein